MIGYTTPLICSPVRRALLCEVNLERVENLRVVTPAANQVNRKRPNKNNVSGIRGVQHVPRLSASKPWRAQITANRKNLHLGLFATEQEAVAARRAAEREHLGEECP